MARKTRSRWILLVVMAMVLATVGVVYAHWQGSLWINGDVNTGGINLSFGDGWTNDDGNVDNDWTGTDFGGDDAFPFYDAHFGSSRDPSSELGETRYEKDVAACWAHAGGDSFNFHIDNAYPSYYCLMGATVFGEWSVPVKATLLTLTGTKFVVAEDAYCGYYVVGTDAEIPWYHVPDEGDYYDDGADGIPIMWDEELGPYVPELYPPGTLYHYCDETEVPLEFAVDQLGFFDVIGNNGVELTGEFDIGIACGTQIDPGDQYQTQGWLHIEQPADMGARYEFHMEQQYVNWNEFEPEMCFPPTG